MNQDIKKFLVSVLGDKGFDALERMCKNDNSLYSFLEIRTILSWINNIMEVKDDYKDKIPGFPLSQIELKKNIDNTYSSNISLNDSNYSIERTDLLSVVSAIGIAFGIEFDNLSKNSSSSSMKNIGQALDLLTKVNIIQNSKLISQKIKFPLSSKVLKLNKNEIKNECSSCGEPFIEKNDFIGCLCLSELQKYITLEEDKDSYLFKVAGLNKNEIEEFISLIRK